MTDPEALQPQYFDELYARKADPWSVQSRWYEERKRYITMATLPHQRYGSALEIGCSLGVLTALLAERCELVTAVDIAEAAVAAARERLRGHANVTVQAVDVSAGLPAGSYDLIMLSEVGYYFEDAGLATLVQRIDQSLTAGGTLVACHWLHPVADYPLSGPAVHQKLRGHPGWFRLAQHLEEDFMLEVFSHDSRSVAKRTGVN